MLGLPKFLKIKSIQERSINNKLKSRYLTNCGGVSTAGTPVTGIPTKDGLSKEAVGDMTTGGNTGFGSSFDKPKAAAVLVMASMAWILAVAAAAATAAAVGI